MSLNESIVEDAALEWFGELGYAVGHGPHLAPGEPAAERDSFSEVVLVGRLREAIRRPAGAVPAISSHTPHPVRSRSRGTAEAAERGVESESNMKSQYCLYQEDRVFFGHVERGLLAVLNRRTNQSSESKAVAAMLTGLWNLPFITPGLFCAIEYCPNEAAMRFEISEEVLSFTYGSGFHASFWPGDECRHIGSRFGESSDAMNNYHSWKALLEMFESGLSDEETPFTVELISCPSLASSPSWNKLPSWESRGFPGIKDIQS